MVKKKKRKEKEGRREWRRKEAKEKNEKKIKILCRNTYGIDRHINSTVEM